MLRVFIKSLIFILAIFAVLEISIRFIYFGTDALSIHATNSYTLILDSDLVQPAEHPDIYYELKPNLESTFRGKRFTTNSDGLADKQYSKAKPEDVFRIAVVGSSWTMATGVEVSDAYHTLLEERLQGQLSVNKVEIINFGVEYYGLGEIIATIRNKVLAYEPDMVILATTAMTPAILWTEHTEPFTKADTIPAFWQSYTLLKVSELIRKTAYKSTRRPQVKLLRGGFMRQVNRSMKEFAGLLHDKHIDGVVIWLTYDKLNETMIRASAIHAKNNGLGFIPINMKTEADIQNVKDSLIVGRGDRHPNETGHRLIAEKLYQELWAVDNQAAQP